MSEHRTRPPTSSLLSGALASLLVWSQLLLLGPAYALATNPGEIDASLGSLLPWWLLAAGGGWLLTTALGGVLPARARQAWTALLLSLGVALFLQGTFLLGEYGLLDGRPIDWSANAQRAPWEAALWLALLVGGVFFRARLVAWAGTVTAVILAAQVAGLLGELRKAPAFEGRTARVLPPEIAQLSRDRNALLIVLDGFQSDVFEEIVDAEPERFEPLLEGFTFFADHAGAFPTTAMSIPAMLSGHRYENREPLMPFALRHSHEESLVQSLGRAGFERDVLSIIRHFAEIPADHNFSLRLPYTSESLANRFAALQLIDLSLFRHAPHWVKPLVYADREWLLQRRFGEATLGYHATSGRVFVEELTDDLVVSRERPVFKLLHIGPPHLPVVVDGECRFVGLQQTTRARYAGQARCALGLIGGLLERMKALGAYDESLIVIASDHGASTPPRGLVQSQPPLPRAGLLMGQASALLLVKPPGAAGPLQRSRVPSAITDIGATMLDLLEVPVDLPGAPLFRAPPDASRPRYFATYRWRQEDWRRTYVRVLHRFAIEGPLHDASSWRPLGPVFSPELRLEAEEIDLGVEAARIHLGPTWGPDVRSRGATHAWVEGPEVLVFASLPVDQPLSLSARLESAVANAAVDVSVDGAPLGAWRPAADGAYHVHRLAIPARAERPPISEIAFRFRRDDARGGALRSLRPARFDWVRIGPAEGRAEADAETAAYSR